MAKTYLEREPYYTSSIWTLYVDGKAYLLGEGPKFVQRAMGWDYRDFVRTAKAEAKRQHKAIDGVWLGRYLLRCLGGRAVISRFKDLEPWELWA